MPLQLIVQHQNLQEISASLGELDEFVELFPIAGALWGISIPTKVTDRVGEDSIRKSLSKFNVYDLYGGEWRYA